MWDRSSSTLRCAATSKLPPVEVEQVASAAANEDKVQVLGPCGTTDGAGHGGPRLPPPVLGTEQVPMSVPVVLPRRS